MKLKVKITGWSEGKRSSITRTIETPEFKDRNDEFLGRPLFESSHDHQVRWVDDHYESVIVPLAEAAWFWPIEGFTVVPPKGPTKKEMIYDICEITLKDWQPENKAIFLGILHKQWSTLKRLSVTNIIKNVIGTMDIANEVSIAHLRDITEILKPSTSNLIK